MERQPLQTVLAFIDKNRCVLESCVSLSVMHARQAVCVWMLDVFCPVPLSCVPLSFCLVFVCAARDNSDVGCMHC